MISISIFLTGLCSSALLSPLQHAHAQTLQGCAAVDCPNRYENMLSPVLSYIYGHETYWVFVYHVETCRRW